MCKKILMYKDNIIYCIAILAVLSLAVMFYSGAKEGYFRIFLLAVIVAPILIIINPKNSIKTNFVFTVIIFLAIVLYAAVFWRFKDGHLLNSNIISQVPEEARSQFSFENELKINLLFVCSSISTLISLIIRAT